MRIGGREENRRGAQKSVFATAQNLGRNVLHLARGRVETCRFAAVDQIGMKRIRRNVAILFNADRAPVAKSDRAVVATTLHAR